MGRNNTKQRLAHQWKQSNQFYKMHDRMWESEQLNANNVHWHQERGKKRETQCDQYRREHNIVQMQDIGGRSHE